jgi:Flp pilus assembly protein TadD
LTASRGARLAGLAGLFVLALWLRGVHLGAGLPEVWEEAIPVREAVELWGPPGGDLHLDPGFFKYPSLTIYLNFLAQGAWYFGLSLAGRIDSLNDFRQLLAQDLGAAVLLGRGLQAVLGALLVLPAVFLSGRLAGRTAGWLAGALVAVLPLAVRESQVIGPDPALALFAGAALVAAVGIVDTGSRRSYLWAGLWIGLAASAKYPGALLVVALLTAHAIRVRREEGPAAGVVLSTLLIQAFFLAGLAFAATSPYVLLDPGSALRDIGFESRHMAIGHLGREQGRAFAYYVSRGLPQGWTPVGALLALAGVVVLLARRETRVRAIPGALFATVFLLVLGSWRMAAPRYLLPLAPLGAAWGGALVAIVAAGARRPSVSRLLLGGGAVLLLAAPAVTTLRQLQERGGVDSRVSAAAWIEQNVPAGSSILVERYGPEPDPDTYLVLYLPFHAVAPHVYDDAYVTHLYRTFDYVVLSSGVSARYLAKPLEYPQQASFYPALLHGFREVAVFDGRLTTGPVIRILERRRDAPVPGVAALPAAYFANEKGNGPLAEYLSALGTVLVREGEEEEGFRLLNEAVEMDGESAKVWGNLGAMRVRSGRPEEALLAFRRAQDLAPEDPEVAYNLGTLFARMGERRQAAEQFQRAIRSRPGMEEAYLPLARVLVEEVRYAQARAVLHQFLDRFPRSPQREAARDALGQLARMGPGRP